MNALTITGNLVDKPERVDYEGGTLANFRIGNSEWIKDENRLNGFFDVTVFGPQAEQVLAKLNKGQRVIVSGRIQQRTFDREDGTKGSRTTLVAQAVGISLEFADKDNATESVPS